MSQKRFFGVRVSGLPATFSAGSVIDSIFIYFIYFRSLFVLNNLFRAMIDISLILIRRSPGLEQFLAHFNMALKVHDKDGCAAVAAVVRAGSTGDDVFH